MAVVQDWEMVDRARRLAYDAHAGQTDKAGEPYVQAHVADVAARVHPWGPDAVTVAWLHDVVEDTEYTLDDLRSVFSGVIVDAVDAITRRSGEATDAYYARVRVNDLARIVKMFGDIPSNTDPERLELLPAEVRNRLVGKYAHAIEVLAA